MSTVRVTVEGVPSFTWEGSAVDVERLLEKVHAASQSGDVTAAQLTDFCVLELWKNQGKVSADMKGSQMTGVLWRILTSRLFRWA